MSLLPSLANLFAFYDGDPDSRRRVREAMSLSGDFERIASPYEGWVVGWARLPESEPLDRELSRFHLAFAEGRDSIADRRGTEPVEMAHLAQTTTDKPQELARFAGDFGFVHFRPRGRATVVRSCGGLAPFYFWRGGERTAISTLYTWLVRFLPLKLELDPLPNAIWAMGHPAFPGGRTFLMGVSIVPRGHAVSLGEGAPKVARYWDPRPDELPKRNREAEREHAERLRAILVAKLETELHPKSGNLLTLSGGVNSSCLAALATRTLGKKIGTFSVVPGREDLLAHEMSYIRPLVEHPNVERSWYLYADGSPMLDLFDEAPPVAFHVPHPALCKLRSIHREWPVRVLFGGEWADETCGSHFTSQDWKELVPLGHLAAGWLLGRMPVGPLDPLRVLKYRVRRAADPFATMPLFFSDEVLAEYRDWADARAQSVRADPRPFRHLSEHLNRNDGFLAMNWEVASALGVRRSFPFISRETLELTYSCRPEEMLGPKTKKLLRRALQGDVPHRNLYRPKKSRWGAALERPMVVWQQPLPPVLGSLLRSEWMPCPPGPIAAGDAQCLGRLARAVSLLTDGSMATSLSENIRSVAGGQRA